MSIDKALAILRARTPGRWFWDSYSAIYGGLAQDVDGDPEYPRVIPLPRPTQGDITTPQGEADARAIVLAANTIEAALAVAEAARDAVAQAEHSTSGALWHYEVEDLRESLAALDAAIEEAT